jgi:hypothetical protein
MNTTTQFAFSNDLGSELIKILGLPEDVIWFDIKFRVNDAVRIQGECFAPLGEPEIRESFKGVLKEYKFVKDAM